VLHGIDLTVAEGSALAILGPNGAGKSTLCAAIAGLLAPGKGRVLFSGGDVTTVQADLRAKDGLVLVPESRGIFPGVTVDDNLALWLADPGDREAAYERFPNLAARRKIYAGNLSGGEQQILSLAGLMIRPPKLLVVDEPTLGLSPTMSDEVVATLRELHAQGVTMILVEEKAVNVLKIAEYVGVLVRGHLLQVRPTSEVNEQQLSDAYLGSGLVLS
jgi:ABC-type branched-subunit amino acid transport system ATPase component